MPKTGKEKKVPLGFVELSNGAKKIYPMNDIFLNYKFQMKENWEILRMMVNILTAAFNRRYPTKAMRLIEVLQEVRTQFKHLTDVGNTTRDRDIKIAEKKPISTYVEFQNRAITRIPVPVRAVRACLT